MEETESAPMDITKLVINNQMKTELHKSPPIKTYSKRSPDMGSNGDGERSRYGRERKHNASSDFLSTDHRLGQYLKQQTLKEVCYKKTTQLKAENRGTGRTRGRGRGGGCGLVKRGRGRPRKSLPDLSRPADSSPPPDKHILDTSLPSMHFFTDYQAPVPTSREMLPVPAELNVEGKCESEPEEELKRDADWDCGDLAWGAVPSFPYWPCAITRDPVDQTFVKHSCVGRATKPQMLLHVRFFGDNGRRSWVKATNLMSFTGLDDYQTLVEETCTPQLKRTNMKMYRMFTVLPSQRKGWQAAVSEAESLLASPRCERLHYFESLYPEMKKQLGGVKKRTESFEMCSSTDEYRKRKVDKMCDNTEELYDGENEKRIKVDRYSIDLDTLALQAAPITPRAEYMAPAKKMRMNNCGGVVNEDNKCKRTYIKKSEKWLLCNNKIKTGIVAEESDNSQSNSSYLIRVKPVSDVSNSKTKNLNFTSVEDDFALPVLDSTADLVVQPSVTLTQTPVETSKDVTAIEFDTYDHISQETEELKDVRGISTGTCCEEVENVSMTELAPVETSPVATDQPVSEIISVLPQEVVPEVSTPVVMERPKVISPVPADISPPADSSTTTPTKRSRGRPRKFPPTPSVTPPPKPKEVEKVRCKSVPTDKKNRMAVRSSGRPNIAKKSLQLSDSDNHKSVKGPTKPQKIKEPPVDLDIRKFGYKGSKVFKKFLELNFDKIVDERPDLSVKDVEKYIEDLWLRKTDSARHKFKSRVDAESESDFIVDKNQSNKSKTEAVPLALPSKASTSIVGTPLRKMPSLFQGIKLDRVCQICLKGENLVRCKGPCVSYYHKECGDNRAPAPHKQHDESVKKKRGRKKFKMEDEEIKTEAEIKSEPVTPTQIKIDSDSAENEIDTDDTKPEKESIVSGLDVGESSTHCSGENSTKCNVTSSVSNPIDRVDSSSSKLKLINSGTADENDGDIKLEGNPEEKENVLPKDANENVSRSLFGSVNKAMEGGLLHPPSVMDRLKPDLSSIVDSTSSQDSIKSEDVKSSSSEKSESGGGGCGGGGCGGVDSDNEGKKTCKVIVKKLKLQDKNSDSDSSDNGKGKGNGNGNSWKCLMCTENLEDPCFICLNDKQENKIRCCISSCGLMYHLSCVETWPQNHTMVGAKGRTVLTCPQHSCHTCISDNPKANMPKYNMDKLVKCLYCPTSYHHSNYCVPAGCEILSNSQIICPRHYNGHSKLHHVNAAWCFICSVGGSLICCDLCPNSFHVECLNIPSPEGSFICEDCETGRYPLYGEIIWVKLGAYRWWPAKILFRSEIPDNIKLLPHKRGEFAIRFFGSHDYYWVNRGRVFLYHEGDGETVATKSRVDRIFNQAMIEAREAFTTFTAERDEREAVNKSCFKPPKYIKINKNVCQNSKLSCLLRPVEGYVANLTPCDCKPEQDSPCGPNSDCINRLLMIECNAQVCPAKEKCCNQNFEKRLYPSLVPFMTDTRGWGLKTNEPIRKGDFIIEYVGEVIDEEEYHRRLNEMQKKKNENYYFLTIDKDTMLDAGPKGNHARFMNHSCNPNCETQKWTVNGVTRVGLFALDDIPKDTELVFNYQLETIGSSKVSCKCSATNCTGFIGGAKSINKGGDGNKSKQENEEKVRKKSIAGSSSSASAQVKRSKRSNSRSANKIMSDFCFKCDEGGELLLCDSPHCPNGYHLSCLGLTNEPTGEWICPVHVCCICNQPKVKRCTLCISSYCNKHAQGNISRHKSHGLVCRNHAFSEENSDLDGDTTKQEITACANISSTDQNTSATQQPLPHTSSTSHSQQLINGHL